MLAGGGITWRARHGGQRLDAVAAGRAGGRGRTSPSMRSTVSSRSCQKQRCPAIGGDVGQREA